MKISRSLCFPAAAAAVCLFAAPSAQAWPFVKKVLSDGTPEGVLPCASAADFDGDGRLEFYGGGDDIGRAPVPGFTTLPPCYLDGSHPYSGLITDPNLDGIPDIARMERDASGKIYLLSYRGHSDGTFSTGSAWDSVAHVWPGDATTAARMIEADITGKDSRDIVVAVTDKEPTTSIYQSNLRVYRWGANPSGWGPGYTAPGSISVDFQGDLDDSDRFTCVAAADFDGDGWKDLIVGDAAKDILRLYDNQGGTAFSAMVNAGAETDPKDIIIEDVDRDGRPDIIVSCFEPGGTVRRLSWRRNLGGIFDPPQTIIVSATADYGCPAMADIDEDGDNDLLFTHTAGGATELRYCLRNGSSFSTSNLIGSVAAPGPITSADADGDGDTDLWVMAVTAVTFFENTTVRMAARHSVTAWNGVNPSGATHMITANVNGDAWEDLVCASEGSKKILWYPGSAAGLTAPLIASTQNAAPGGVAAADYDLDGDIDLAYSLPSTGSVWMARNNGGAGSVWVDTYVGNTPGLAPLCTFKSDSDRAPDLAAASTPAGWTGVFISNLTATSWTKQTATSVSDPVLALASIRGSYGNDSLVVIREGSNFTNNKCNVLKLFVPPSSNSSWWIPDLTNTDLASNAIARGNVSGGTEQEIVCSCGTRGIYWVRTLGSGDGVQGLIATAPGTVRQLTTTDWDRDGLNDVLCASSAGVHLYRNAGTSWETIPLIASGDFRGVVTLKLNSDARIDAVAVNAAGQLQLIHNSSVQATIAQDDAFSQDGRVRMLPGTQNPALSLALTHQGRTASLPFQSDAASLAFDTVRLRFLKAVPSGRSYVPGTVMTDAEIASVLTGITFHRDLGTPNVIDAADVPMSATPVLPASVSGYVTCDPSATAEAAQALTSQQQTGRWLIGLSLKSTAASAGIPRFFMQHVASGANAGKVKPAATASLRGIYTDADLPTSEVLVEVFVPTALQQWRMTHFGTWDNANTAANDFDADGDGVTNIVEYVMNRHPKIVEVIGNSPALEMLSDNPYLPVRFVLRLSATVDPRIDILVEQSTDLNSWAFLAQRTGTAAWTGYTPVSANLNGGRVKHTFSTSVLPALTRRYFLRMKVTELP